MFDKVDLEKTVGKKEYKKELSDLQLRLLHSQFELRKKKVPLVIAYEGWDAAGKGGSILRITQKMDPRGYRVWPIGAPTDEELAHHYLWRFWTRLPAAGEMCIFDRSWYGRVLVERVEKLTDSNDWKRAFDEICAFEKGLVDAGYILVKFWLHISKEEQLKRFEKRESDPFKKWKITEDDWRNREKWDLYYEAAEEMFEKTSKRDAKWHVVSAECKRHARLETARIVLEKIEKRLEELG